MTPRPVGWGRGAERPQKGGGGQGPLAPAGESPLHGNEEIPRRKGTIHFQASVGVR